MPQGVEQLPAMDEVVMTRYVTSSQMPQGVEHTRNPLVYAASVACRHLRCREALSTIAANAQKRIRLPCRHLSCRKALSEAVDGVQSSQRLKPVRIHGFGAILSQMPKG